MTLTQARRRSRLVATARIGLSAGAMLCVAVFLGHLAGNAVDRALQSRSVFRSQEMVTMINPRFIGRNARGEPYVLTADTAERQRENEDLVDLTSPKLVDAEGSEIIAPRGLYNRELQTLELYDDVQVSDARGYVFGSTHARIYVQEDRVEGLVPLDGTGPIGDLRADSYEILDDGDLVVLRGNVVATIYPEDEDKPAAEGPSGAQSDTGDLGGREQP